MKTAPCAVPLAGAGENLTKYVSRYRLLPLRPRGGAGEANYLETLNSKKVRIL